MAGLQDVNITLFGADSIVGRSVGVADATDDAVFACATIKATGMVNVLQASFNSSIIGKAVFSQAVGSASTSIAVELTNAQPISTLNHDW